MSKRASVIVKEDPMSESTIVKLKAKGVELPSGITEEEWAVEKVKFQNPRIRLLLGCIHLIEEVLDSNYAILHCSRSRLIKIWQHVRKVCHLIRSGISPTLKEPSMFPDLDAAIHKADYSFKVLEISVIKAIERYPDQLTPDQQPAVRELLCVSVNSIYSFLRDTLGELLANDPRSRYDADYFLSKSFARDIEESESLYSSVYELRERMDGLQKLCSFEFETLLRHWEKEQMIPPPESWTKTEKLLQMLLDDLVPKLKEVLSQRSVRVKEIESLDRYAFEIPHQCKALIEIYEVGREVVGTVKSTNGGTLKEREQTVEDLLRWHRVVSRRMFLRLSDLETTLRNLACFLPLWQSCIEKRRCLMLSKVAGGMSPHSARSVSGTGDRKRKQAEL
jgi:hypothetical protein